MSSALFPNALDKKFIKIHNKRLRNQTVNYKVGIRLYTDFPNHRTVRRATRGLTTTTRSEA
jgi:hypothetical protein